MRSYGRTQARCYHSQDHYTNNIHLTTASSKISWLVENMVSMAADTITPEKCWEALALTDLLFRDSIVCIRRFANNEFANL